MAESFPESEANAEKMSSPSSAVLEDSNVDKLADEVKEMNVDGNNTEADPEGGEKKKKKKEKKKKKKKQTEPPTVGLTTLFPSLKYPEDEIQAFTTNLQRNTDA